MNEPINEDEFVLQTNIKGLVLLNIALEVLINTDVDIDSNDTLGFLQLISQAVSDSREQNSDAPVPPLLFLKIEREELPELVFWREPKEIKLTPSIIP